MFTWWQNNRLLSICNIRQEYLKPWSPGSRTIDSSLYCSTMQEYQKPGSPGGRAIDSSLTAVFCRSTRSLGHLVAEQQTPLLLQYSAGVPEAWVTWQQNNRLLSISVIFGRSTRSLGHLVAEQQTPLQRISSQPLLGVHTISGTLNYIRYNS